MRCDTCGKYRRRQDLAGSNWGDNPYREELVIECWWCMSDADRKHFHMEETR